MIPEKHSRKMRREFHRRYLNIAKVTPFILDDMYQFLSGDTSKLPNEQIRERLHYLIDHHDIVDEDIIVDLRRLNSGQPSKFDEFWEYMDKVLNEYSEAAADSRRHGVATLPVAISIEDLRQRVIEKIPPEKDVAVPSVSSIYLQFLPKHPWAHSALRNTGRFKIKYKVQARHLHARHVDSRYTGTCFSYLKNFVVRFSEYASLVCQDDKHSVCVGEPEHPTACLDRGRRVLGMSGLPVTSMDHDFTTSKVVPSVSLVCDIPESVESSFYRGTVVVHPKDGIFYPSSALRHAWELIDVLHLKHGVEVPPILGLYTDGGPDHNPTHSSVQLALITAFRKLNLDSLIAVRTAPGGSFINPVERIMSLLNLAMQGVTLEKKKVGSLWRRFYNYASQCQIFEQLL